MAHTPIIPRFCVLYRTTSVLMHIFSANSRVRTYIYIAGKHHHRQRDYWGICPNERTITGRGKRRESRMITSSHQTRKMDSTLKALEYFCINYGDQKVFQFEIMYVRKCGPNHFTSILIIYSFCICASWT